ncbi:MAG: 2-amino-4-hydroxy-6-hydroxymethyldihydropteridine diphosphokinase [Egibacteraceae bacterium]
MSALSARLPSGRAGAFAFLGLGSNLGDRLEYLQRAVDLLENDERTRVDAVSSVYESEPVGGPAQDDFLNLAVRIHTRRSPGGLLRQCQAVEGHLGRRRDERWGPRVIDLDVLLYDRRTVTTRTLQIPHPRLLERAFALVPLVEVAPGMLLPDDTTLTAALARLAPIDGLTMVGSQVQPPEERTH